MLPSFTLLSAVSGNSRPKKSHDTNRRIVGIKQEKEGGKRQKPKGASKQKTK